MSENDPKVENKVVKSYTLKPVNIAWLTQRAAEETLAQGTYVSAAALLDLLIDNARVAYERSTLADRLKKAKWN